MQTYNRSGNGFEKQESCPDCQTALKVFRVGFKEEVECPGCGYYEA